jgi:hypothetical protein
MRLPALWKIQRELRRVRSQLMALVELTYLPWLRFQHSKRRLDANFCQSGQASSSSKIAIFLVYQPQGLQASTIHTLQYLIDCGYAPLTVINGSLPKPDLDKIKAQSWRIITRKNFGYDFGGYQDGIWYLTHHQIQMKCLLILNDSIWFPVLPASKLLDFCENHSAQYTGAMELQSRRNSHRFKSGRKFFGSFFLHLKSDALRHPVFQQFWLSYKATSNKYMTIKRGEKDLSFALLDAGISNAAFFSRQHIDDWLRFSSSDELAAALRYLVSMDSTYELMRTQLLNTTSRDANWLTQIRQLAFAITHKQNILSSAPLLSLTNMQVPFIKKSTDPHNLKALRLLSQQAHAGRIDLDRTVLAEIDAVLMRQLPIP